MASEEQRAYRRLPMKVNIRYRRIVSGVDYAKQTSSEIYSATSDLSAGGLSFLSEESWEEGSLLGMMLELPAEEEPVACEVRVVRTRYEAGMQRVGVVFLDLSGRDRRRIETFVKKES